MKVGYTMSIVRGLLLATICVMACPRLLEAQPVSWNVNLLGTWSDNAIPIVSGHRYNDVYGYAAGGREYAIVGASNANYIIEVTNPASPVVRATLTSGCTSTRWRDHAIYQNYLYVISDNCAGGGLQVWDLSPLPAAPTLMYNATTFFASAHTIFINPVSARLYAAGCNTQTTGIKMISLANPIAPTQMFTLNLGAYTHDVYVHNDTVYTFHGNNGIACWDFHNMAAPAQLDVYAGYPDAGYAHSGYGLKNNKYLITTDETQGKQVKVVNISDPRNMTHVTLFQSALLAPTYTNNIGHNPVTVGNMLYLSYYEDGLQIYDMTTPSAPVKVGYYDTYSNTTYTGMIGAWGVHPPLPSGNILVTDMVNGLFVLKYIPPLPVEWESFDATALYDRVRLDWTTTSEVNNVGFVVERSANGVDFEDVKHVDGAGNSQEARDYTAFDERPLPGISYYRIRQIDANGETKTSNVRSVDLTNARPEMTVYPSPAHKGEAVALQLTVQEAVSGTLSAFDMLGKQIFQTGVSLAPGLAEVALPTQDWTAGTYLLRLDAGTYHLEQKLLITN